MAEKDKGFKFRRLFFRDAGTGTQGKQIQKEEPVSTNIPQVSVGIPDQSLVEEFVQRSIIITSQVLTFSNSPNRFLRKSRIRMQKFIRRFSGSHKK
jgi:hypothetical protein